MSYPLTPFDQPFIKSLGLRTRQLPLVHLPIPRRLPDAQRLSQAASKASNWRPVKGGQG